MRSLTPLLLVCASLVVACGSETAVGPEAPRIFSALELMPAAASLKSVASGNTVQLSVLAWDQHGVPMPGARAATYSSGAPAVVEVSNGGGVTAIAPGSARIEAALTIGGITQTATMTVRVRHDYSDIAGVYDLTALVTSFNSIWGELRPSRYTAVLRLDGGEPPALAGTFTGLWLIGPAGDSVVEADSGLVESGIDFEWGDFIRLYGTGTLGHIEMGLRPKTVAPGFISGTFSSGGARGSFEAKRR